MVTVDYESALEHPLAMPSRFFVPRLKIRFYPATVSLPATANVVRRHLALMLIVESTRVAPAGLIGTIDRRSTKPFRSISLLGREHARKYLIDADHYFQMMEFSNEQDQDA